MWTILGRWIVGCSSAREICFPILILICWLFIVLCVLWESRGYVNKKTHTNTHTHTQTYRQLNYVTEEFSSIHVLTLLVLYHRRSSMLLLIIIAAIGGMQQSSSSSRRRRRWLLAEIEEVAASYWWWCIDYYCMREERSESCVRRLAIIYSYVLLSIHPITEATYDYNMREQKQQSPTDLETASDISKWRTWKGLINSLPASL